MGTKHQGMNRPGVRRVREDSRELRKMKKTGCEVIADAPTTPVVNGKVKVKVKIELAVLVHSKGTQTVFWFDCFLFFKTFIQYYIIDSFLQPALFVCWQGRHWGLLPLRLRTRLWNVQQGSYCPYAISCNYFP